MNQRSRGTFLRWGVDDVAAWEAQVRLLREASRVAESAADLCSALGELGDVLRLSPRAEDVAEAIAVLERACAEAVKADDAALLATNQVRLAIALQYANRHEEAIRLHGKAIATITEHGIERLEDFAWQHLGKCHAECGDDSEAHRCFQEALRLRKARGDAELIASTEGALAELDRNRKAGKET